MIQRIQTVFLLVIMICMGLVNFFVLWSETINPENIIVLKSFGATQDGQVMAGYYFVPGILSLLVGIVALVEILQYKNRLTQVKLGALNALLLAGMLICSIYFISDLEKIQPQITGNYGIGLGFPAIALIANLLANRFIRRDEKLVPSVDRIR